MLFNFGRFWDSSLRLLAGGNDPVPRGDSTWGKRNLVRREAIPGLYDERKTFWWNLSPFMEHRKQVYQCWKSKNEYFCVDSAQGNGNREDDDHRWSQPIQLIDLHRMTRRIKPWLSGRQRSDRVAVACAVFPMLPPRKSEKGSAISCTFSVIRRFMDLARGILWERRNTTMLIFDGVVRIWGYALSHFAIVL